MKNILRALLLAVYAGVLSGQGFTSLTAVSLDGITNATPIDNRSNVVRRAKVHTFCATGTGTWTAQIQYSDAASTGPWTSFPDAYALVSNGSPNCVGVAIGYHPYIRFNLTGSVSVSYRGLKDLYIPSASPGSLTVNFSNLGAGTNSTGAVFTLTSGTALTYLGTGVLNANQIVGTALPNLTPGSAITGNGSKLATWSGALTQNAIVVPDAFGNLIASATLISSIMTTSTVLGCGQVPAFTSDITASGCVITLANSGVSPGTYGDATNTPRITVDVKGRITAITTVPTSGGGSGTSQVCLLTRTSATVLTFAASATPTNPCNPAIGSQPYPITAPIAITLSGANGGTIYCYVDSGGTLTVGYAGSGGSPFVSGNVTVASPGVSAFGITDFPSNPSTAVIGSWTATAGSWDTSGLTKSLPEVSGSVIVLPGANATVARTKNSVTVGFSGVTASPFDPTDQGQYWKIFRFFEDVSFTQGVQGVSYYNCNAGTTTPASGLDAIGVTSAIQIKTPSPTDWCIFYFPGATGTGTYGNGVYDFFSGSTPKPLRGSASLLQRDNNGNFYIGYFPGQFIPTGNATFVGCRYKSSTGKLQAVIRSGSSDIATSDVTWTHDSNSHRFVFTNSTGAWPSAPTAVANSISCGIDGGTLATATGTIPVSATAGWVFGIAIEGGGSSATEISPWVLAIHILGL